MNDTQKMLQAILNGQGAIKQELISKIDKVEEKLGGRIDGLEGKIDGLDGKIDGVEKRLTGRLDKIGRQFAYLEDDAPTREEFDSLEERVDKIERKATPTL
ncbi:MAG: Uncharacterized protein G01um101493_81 [Microgenomates group bacterium Gr01-1014_93]|nr:MAG: Uncharacterized protein G01um101493_81 [Microgenomates group bacterium Gr01-1014_93]